MKIIFLVLKNFIVLFSTKLALTQNISVLSIGICEIIDKFYAKYSRNLDIIDFGGTHSELIEQIMKNVDNSMTIALQSIINWDKWNKKIESQSILLFDSFKNLSHFTNKDLFDMRYLNPIRLVVYYPDARLDEIVLLRTDTLIAHYYYFITTNQEPNTTQLWTFDNRNDLEICHESQQTVCVNEFSSFKLKWKFESIFPKKHKNFFGCTMNIGVEETENLFHIYLRNNQAKTNDFIFGLLMVFQKHLNFIPEGKICVEYDCSDLIVDGEIYMYNIMTISTTDSVLILYDEKDVRWLHTMMSIECTPQLYIPPSNLYTSMEKLILPFDNETWYGICITFVISCIVITTFNKFPKRFKEIAYGRTGGTRAFNTFQTFFGISHVEVPNGNFARIVMTFFVFWCLVIRTAYQGKLFEFTTTAIRKPELKSLDELKDNNFTLFFSNHSTSFPMLEYTRKVIDMNSKVVLSDEYTMIYVKNLTDPSFTGTVLTCDIEHKLHNFYGAISMPRRFIPTPITKSYYGIGFQHPNLWIERFNEIIEGLVTGGIMNYFLEIMTKSKWNLMNIDEDLEKVVLNMSHLGFGFQICFFSFHVALIVFIFEIIVNWIISFGTIEENDQKESIIDKALMTAFTTSTSVITKRKLKPPEFEERTVSEKTDKPVAETADKSLMEITLEESVDYLFGEVLERTDDVIDV